MSINAAWRQIAGFSILDSGVMGIVWISVDTEWDVVRIHHAIKLERELLAVPAAELNRKRWIPVAWENEEFAQKLQDDYGCNMLPDRSSDSAAQAEVLTNAILERMKTGRFKYGPGADTWAKEYKAFNRDSGQIDRDNFPLMAATRHAVAQIQYARAEVSSKSGKRLYPKVAIA